MKYIAYIKQMKGGKRTDKTVAKCDPDDQDPISRNEFSTIPLERQIRILQNAKYFCFDIDTIYDFVVTRGQQYNPLTRIPFTNFDIGKIQRKYSKVHGDNVFTITAELLVYGTGSVSSDNIDDDELTEKVVTTMGLKLIKERMDEMIQAVNRYRSNQRIRLQLPFVHDVITLVKLERLDLDVLKLTFHPSVSRYTYNPEGVRQENIKMFIEDTFQNAFIDDLALQKIDNVVLTNN